MNSAKEIVLANLAQWERALALFEKTTGLTTSLYLSDSQRVLGPFANTPLGSELTRSGAFNQYQLAHRAEIEELIPVIALQEMRTKKIADALTVLFMPIRVDGKIIGVVVTGWVFDHFADPIECDRVSQLFGIPSMQLWQIARMQAPVSPEKIAIYQEMLTLIISTLTDQLISIKILKDAAKVKDELLNMVSHELKTPLTSLLLRVQMLRSHRVPENKIDSFIEGMEINAKVQSRLIEDLLDAAKIASGKFQLTPTPLDLHQVLTETMDLVSDVAQKKSVTLDYYHLGNDYRYNGDELRLKQALWNLLMNAIKFSPEKSKIEVSLTRNISHFMIRVRDEGLGIDSRHFSLIFDRFTQAAKDEMITPNEGGLGLGLFIVKNIIEGHGGTIEVDSQGANKGSTFELFLPFA